MSRSSRSFRVFLATHLKEAEETGERPEGIEIACYTARVGSRGQLELTDYNGEYLMCFNERLWAWVERIPE